MKKDYPSLDQELIKEKASDLSSGEITININISYYIYENDDGEEETNEINISRPIFFPVMTPLIEIRQKILNVLDGFFQTIFIWGYYSVNIDGNDTKCRDTKYLSGCLDDLNYSSKNINVYLDASEPIDPSDEDFRKYYQIILKKLLMTKIYNFISLTNKIERNSYQPNTSWLNVFFQ